MTFAESVRAQKTFTRLFFVEILVSSFFFSIVLEFLNFSTSKVLVSYKPVSYKKNVYKSKHFGIFSMPYYCLWKVVNL